MMKGLFIVFLLVSISTNLLAQNIYIDRWPMVNDDNVNIRDYPDLRSGTVKFKVHKDQKIIIRYKTIDKKEINGTSNYWYYVTIFERDYQHQNGWIYGEYISFIEGFDEDYWNSSIFEIKPIDERIAYKNIVADRIINRLFGKSLSFSLYNIELLNGKDLINQQASFLWYMRESKYDFLNTYHVEYGYVMGFVNEIEKKWYFYMLVMDKLLEGIEIFPGMNMTEVTKIFGNDYSITDDTINYNFNEDFDSYFWSFKIENSKVVSFSIRRYYT
jgi:hypothetical protein